MFRVYLGLGSNLGDRLHYLSSAVRELKEIVRVVRISAIYETEPVGMAANEPFYNMVMETETNALPPALLQELKSIETKLGRKPGTHWKPREIDIDIELYDGYIYKDNTVEVPHTELHNRKFLLAPLHELIPELKHPILKKTMKQLYEETTDNHQVIRTNYLLTV